MRNKRRHSFFNRRAETIHRDELDRIQAKLFRATIKHAYSNSLLYRQTFKNQGAKPEDIKSIKDLQKMKFFTTKDDLRKSFPFGALAVPRNRVVEIHASSGTTGTPTLGLHTAEDIEDWGEVSARSLAMSGLGKEDVFQITPSLGMFSGGFGFYHGARKIGCTIVPSGAGFSKRQLEYMKSFGTTMISAIVSYAFRLAEVAEENGVNLKEDTLVRKGSFGSEIWTKETKKRISNLWGMDPYDIYGFTEIYGPGMGNDCFVHEGLHMWEDYLLVEVVDPENGELVGAEEEGELVFTTLRKVAMPLLRYRSRDISALLDSRSCDCGRTHRRWREITGRSDDMIKVSGVNFWPSQIEEILLGESEVLGEYLINVTRENALDRVRIKVESKEKLEDQNRRENLAKKLAQRLRESLLFSSEVEVVDPNSLPRVEVGKAKRVFDEREKP
jgi:phenylacetate-CoA ligase